MPETFSLSLAMKRWKMLITRHWRTKLMSLLLGVLIWGLVRYAIRETRTATSPPSATAPQAPP